MNKLSYDAAWADLVAMARTNAGVLAVVAGAFLLLPNFAQLLFAPPPEIHSLDWNGIKLLNEYFSDNALTLFLCNLPVWLGSAAILAMLLDPRRLTVGEALSGALVLLPSVILLNLLIQIATFAGLALLILPGLYLIGRFALAAPAQMAERLRNPLEAVRRALALTRGNGWRVAGLIVLIAVVATIVGAVINFVLGIALTLILPKAALGAAAALLKSGISAATALLIILLSAALYRQLAPAA